MSRRRHNQEGFLLLEVLIAVLIFSIGVIGMVMLQAVSSANSTNSEDRTTAAVLAGDLISELWSANSANAPPDYAAWRARVTASLRDGQGTLATVGNSGTITIQWSPQARAEAQSAQYITQVTITPTVIIP